MAISLLIHAAFSILQTPLQPPSTTGSSSGIQITRAVPAGVLAPEPSRQADYLLTKRLAGLAIHAFYGEYVPWDGPVAYMQRAIISEDVLQDLTKRLKFYEEARGLALRHLGAVYLAEDASTGDIVGFADVGVSLYNTRTRSFRLPKRPEGEPGYGTEAMSHLQCRPYLSNLAVDESFRRRGVGRLLVDACEAEARMWDSSAAASTAVTSAGADAMNSEGVEDGDARRFEQIWLEVSLNNDDALQFYKRLGYEFVGETRGKEIVRKRFGFESEEVKRGVLRKPLRPTAT